MQKLNTKKIIYQQFKDIIHKLEPFAKNVQKIGKKVGKKILKKGLKITILTLRVLYRAGRTVYRKYKKLDKHTQKKLKRGLLIGGGSVLVAGAAWHAFPSKSSKEQNIKNNIENTDSIIDQTTNNITSLLPQDSEIKTTNHIQRKLTKKYKITDEKSFRQLYEAALPIFQLSMIPTELIELAPYDDRHQGNPNTIGEGLYWYPEDGNPKNPKWILTSKYVKQHPEIQITGGKSLDLTDSWCRNREDGRVYHTMYKKLKGATLTPHQYAMIMHTTFNSERLGFKFCEFVRDNYKDPLKCALKLITLDPKDKNCVNGILKRHFDAACGYLYPDYIEAIPSFKMKEIVNSKGKKHTVTSVNQFSSEECLAARQRALAKKDDSEFRKHAIQTIKWMCKGGQTVAEYAASKIVEKDKLHTLLCYAEGNTVSFQNIQADNSYQQALEEYKQGNYNKALTKFKLLLANGYNGADLHCDIAITYYNLGRYQECIKECQTVLAMGEEQLYPQATYNAGKAYEALHNYERAKMNYNRSVIMAEKNDMSDSMKQIYINAVNRVDTMLPKSSTIGQQSSQKTIENLRKTINSQATSKSTKPTAQPKVKNKQKTTVKQQVVQQKQQQKILDKRKR